MRLAEGRHLVLLNTDLVVPQGWLARLIAPIDAHPEGVASVTPFSNTSSLTGFPDVAHEGPLFMGLSLAQIDTAFRTQTPVDVDLPSGCGFCMALSAAAIAQIGAFDTETYKRGYFEETDWCQRAVIGGFRHVMASNLFVEHKPGSSSFSVAARIALSEANKVKFNARHPAFWERVRLFHYSDPAQRLRSSAKLQLLSDAADKTVLLISHSWGGGLSDYIERAEKTLLAQGAFVINLQCEDSEATVAFRHTTGEHVEKTDMTTALEAILKLGVDEAEIHALHGSENILDQVSALTRALHNVSYRIVLHDFVMVCPTIHLVDNTGRFCGVPGLDKCLDCLHHNSESRYPVLNMSQWRAPWQGLVQGADQIVMLDPSARDIVMRAYPDIDPAKLVVSPPVYQPDLRRVKVPGRTEALNIAVLGVLSKHKGAEVVRNLLRHLEEADDLHSTTLFGEWMSQHSPPESLKLNGRFKAKDLPKLMEKSSTQVVLFPSVCPETYSFTLSEIFAMGLPVVGYEVGAQGRRIAEYDRGVTVPMNDTSSEALLEALKQAAGL
jgi:glycosyltransferase involved in cell wall biosynthesis